QQPLYEKLYEYYRASFGVHLVGFVRDHKNYRQQEAIINTWAPLIKIAEPALADDLNRMNEVLGNGSA
ncbi:MAG TPA: hypothetical protein VJQ25_10480, partial [Nitrospira sp.]|nr:hypothetical protein [Nitrospira sp.]